MAEFIEQKQLLEELGFELSQGDIITESGSVNVQWYELTIEDFVLVTNDIDTWASGDGICMYLEAYKSPKIKFEDIASVVTALKRGIIEPNEI